MFSKDTRIAPMPTRPDDDGARPPDGGRGAARRTPEVTVRAAGPARERVRCQRGGHPPVAGAHPRRSWRSVFGLEPEALTNPAGGFVRARSGRRSRAPRPPHLTNRRCGLSEIDKLARSRPPRRPVQTRTPAPPVPGPPSEGRGAPRASSRPPTPSPPRTPPAASSTSSGDRARRAGCWMTRSATAGPRSGTRPGPSARTAAGRPGPQPVRHPAAAARDSALAAGHEPGRPGRPRADRPRAPGRPVPADADAPAAQAVRAAGGRARLRGPAAPGRGAPPHRPAGEPGGGGRAGAAPADRQLRLPQRGEAGPLRVQARSGWRRSSRSGAPPPCRTSPTGCTRPAPGARCSSSAGWCTTAGRRR